MFDLSNPDVTSSLFSMSARVISLLVIILFILPLQIKELQRPRDSLYLLRIIILSFLVIFAALSIPSIVYHFMKAGGDVVPALSNLSSISTNLGIFAVTIWLVLLYTYKEKK